MDALSHAFIRQHRGALLSNFDSPVCPSRRCTAADVSSRDSLGEASAEPNRKVLNARRSSNANLL